VFIQSRGSRLVGKHMKKWLSQKSKSVELVTQSLVGVLWKKKVLGFGLESKIEKHIFLEIVQYIHID
jgi:hypothetical protein